MRRRCMPLLLMALLATPAWAQDVPHRHGYVPRPEDLQLSPRQAVPPPPAVDPAVPSGPLTVEEAVAIALLRQPTMSLAQGNVRAAAGRTLQAASADNPSFSLSATDTPVASTLFNSAGGGGGGFNATAFVASTGTQATLSARQLLYDFDKTRQAVAQARAQQQATLADLAQAHNDVVFQVRQAFYASLQADRLVSVAETDVQNQREHQRQAEALYKSGVGKPADVVRAENAVATALINLKQAQGDADNGHVNLAHAMGIDPRTPLQLSQSDLPAPAAEPLQDLITRALAWRPEVLAATARVAAGQHAVSAATRDNSPSLSAGASASSLPNPIVPGQQLEIVSANLSLQWPFDNGGLTQGRVEEASGTLQAAQSQLLAARSQVVTDVTQAYVNLGTAEEKLRLSNVAVATAQENLRLAQGRYRAGLGLAIDVLDAESALLQALTVQVNQQSAVDQARAALAHAVGMPL